MKLKLKRIIMEEVLIPLALFAMTGSIVYFAVNGKVKQKKMEHDERMLAIERGVDIPLSPSSTPKKSRTRRLSDPIPLIT